MADDESAGRGDETVRADDDDRAEPVVPAVGLGAMNALATVDDDTRCARKAKRANLIADCSKVNRLFEANR